MSDQLIAAWRRVADRPDGPPSLRIDRSALLGLVEAAEQLRDERDEARATARRQWMVTVMALEFAAQLVASGVEDPARLLRKCAADARLHDMWTPKETP